MPTPRPEQRSEKNLAETLAIFGVLCWDFVVTMIRARGLCPECLQPESVSMSIKDAILNSVPVSYWPLDDSSSAASVHDETGLHAGTVSGGVNLASMPFGPAKAPFFDGQLGSSITIPDDDRYSHPYANALTVACWICPMTLIFPHTDGSTDQFVHVIEKGVRYDDDVEWAMRMYNADSGRPSRLSYYIFNRGSPVGKGAGAYMQYGLSANDLTPVQVGKWFYLVGQGESWIDDVDNSTGSVFHKQAVQAARSPGDKYNNHRVGTFTPLRGRDALPSEGLLAKRLFVVRSRMSQFGTAC